MLTKEQVKELAAQLASTDMSKSSDMFTEQVHSSYSKSPIRPIKFYPLVSEKIAFPLVMMLPFEMTSGVETKEWNSNRRQIIVAPPSETIQVIKMLCEEDPKLKQKYMRSANFSGKWDTSNYDKNITQEDKLVLFIYRRPLTYTFPGMRISHQQVSGEKYPGSFLIDTKQNLLTGAFEEFGEFENLGLLCSAMCKKEIASLNKAIDDKTNDCLSVTLKRSFALAPDYVSSLGATDSLLSRNARGTIRSMYPLSAPMPIIAMAALAFPLTPRSGNIGTKVGEKFELYNHFSEPDVDFKKYLVYTDKYAMKDIVDSIVGNYFPKDQNKYATRNAESDLYPDFCMCDFITENSNESFTMNEKMLAASETRLVTEKKSFYDYTKSEWVNPSIEAFVAGLSGFHRYIAANDMAEQIRDYLKESYKVVTDKMLDSGYQRITDIYPATSPIYDDDIKSIYLEIYTRLFPSEGADHILTSDTVDSGEELYNKLVKEAASSMAQGEIEEDIKEDIDSADVEDDDEEEEELVAPVANGKKKPKVNAVAEVS